MRQPLTSGKKIVSKRKYVAQKGLALSLSGAAIICASILVILPASLPYVCFLEAQEDAKAEAVGSMYDPEFAWSGIIFWGWLLLLVPLAIGAYWLWKQGRRKWTVLREIQPLTHANIVDLPISKSLVRASSEPVQAQQFMLLRAAATGLEKREEQLVRAVNGEQSQ